MLIKVWVIPLLYLDFEIRRDYIVANLCDNRNRPQLNCNGKCFLAKKLAAVQEQEKKQAENNFLSRLISLPSETPVQILFNFEHRSFEMRVRNSFAFHSRMLGKDIQRRIFHPPIFA